MVGIGGGAVYEVARDGRFHVTASRPGPDSGGTVFVVDAGLPSPRPGEIAPASDPMTVSPFGGATGNITIRYGGPCHAPDHHVVHGALSDVAAHAYTGQGCNLRNFGSATFHPGPGDAFRVSSATPSPSRDRTERGGEAPSDSRRSAYRDATIRTFVPLAVRSVPSPKTP